MKYTLQNLLAEFDEDFILTPEGGVASVEGIVECKGKELKDWLTDKITKLVTEAVGIIDELPDREMSSQVKDTREWMNLGRNQLRTQILSVISLDK